MTMTRPETQRTTTQNTTTQNTTTQRTSTLSERIVERLAGVARVDRRGFLRGAAVVGAALSTTPWSYLVRPANAYDAVCGDDNTCADGYSVFCCTINNGANSCPPNSFIGGWWKADSSSFCGGSARYYIDCNAFRDGFHKCRCNTTTCDTRLVACNQFRYGQCNTHIPYSETGPVVCRVISCTPPWQEYAGVCSATARTDNNTSNHNAPCLNGNTPVGALDSVTTSGNSVRLVGWTFDADESGTSISVAVYQDGGGLGTYPTGVARPDVNRAYGISGAHGFDITVTASSDTHTFAVYALNVAGGSGNPLLGSRQISVNPGASPLGRLDSVAVSGNAVRLGGWSYDPDQPSTEIAVAVYMDGAGLGNFATGKPRADVNSAFRINGAHGFELDLTAPSGQHRFDVYGLNVGGGGNNLLGTRIVEVNPGAVPRGALDGVRVVGDSVTIRGWAYDPDDPSAQIDVAVYAYDTGIARFPTGIDRPDVRTAFGIPGRHGYEARFTAPPGVRTFRVYGINVGGGAANPLLGSRTVAVDRPGPLGALDEASVLGRTALLRGWAFDPDRTTVAIPVAVYVDGAGVAWFPTGLRRDDVNAAYAVTGAHGYEVRLDLAPGTHTAAVYGIGARANNFLGSRSFVVQP